MSRLLALSVANLIILFTRVITAVQARWIGCGPSRATRVYFANHASHGDFVLIWTALPPQLRKTTRPVAGSDYWLAGNIRRFIGRDVFNAVLIDRTQARREDPIGVLSDAIDAGSSLILFPEGTRNMTEETLLPFKSGIFHLARRQPEIELVPVWLANLNRVLPKGEFLPIPLLCSVSFGTPMTLAADETKADFLDRARGALLDLAPVASEENESERRAAVP